MKDLTTNEMDMLLCSMGYLPPRNDEELDLFNEMYEDYKSHIANKHVDIAAILNGTCRIVADSHLDNDLCIQHRNDIENAQIKYSMAARNFDNLPKSVLEKMRGQHNIEEGDEN